MVTAKSCHLSEQGVHQQGEWEWERETIQPAQMSTCQNSTYKPD